MICLEELASSVLFSQVSCFGNRPVFESPYLETSHYPVFLSAASIIIINLRLNLLRSQSSDASAGLQRYSGDRPRIYISSDGRSLLQCRSHVLHPACHATQVSSSSSYNHLIIFQNYGVFPSPPKCFFLFQA